MSRKLRTIAITTNTLSVGGAETQRVTLANQLAARGYKVEIYCLQEKGRLEKSVDPRVTVQIRDFWKGALNDTDIVLTGTTNTEVAFGLISKMRNLRASWLVAIHNPLGPEAPRLARFARNALTLARSTIALTPTHAHLIKKTWGFQPDITISNGILVDGALTVAQVRADTTKFRWDVGYLGRIAIHHKGIDRLLHAMAEPAASGLTVAFAGDGPDLEPAKELARKLGVESRVAWLGHQAPVEFFREVNVLAVPSRYEGQPLVLQEAQACGVRVVASLHAGAGSSDLVTVVDASSPAALALALRQTVHRGPVMPSQRIEPPSPYEMADQHIQHFRAILESPRLISSAKIGKRRDCD